MTEEWRPIAGWEGLYEVSSIGRVRSLCFGTPRLRKIKPHPTLGYACFTMKSSGRKQKSTNVHVEMARAFFGPCPKDHEVLHRDGDRMGNRLDNLRYGTRAENVSDTMAHGRVPKGEGHCHAKLNDEQVLAIRADPRGARRLSKAYGVSRGTIGYIRAGKAWRHLLPGGV